MLKAALNFSGIQVYAKSAPNGISKKEQASPSRPMSPVTIPLEMSPPNTPAFSAAAVSASIVNGSAPQFTRNH